VRIRQRIIVICCAPLLGATALSTWADESLYMHKIRPLLKTRCFACHGALKQEAGLRVDTAKLMLSGSDSGPVIDVEQPDTSLLLERIESDDSDYRMPPEGEPLSAEEVTAIRSWLSAGAIAPVDEQPESDPDQHWAFQPLIRPPVPITTTEHDSRLHPIDAFIVRRLDQQGLQPQRLADKPTQLRRIHLNLIGLPPTVEQLTDFLSDDDPSAWDRTVARLLADPRHGERWARHWMDVWRYSDWYGRRNVPDVWNSAPQIWRWRDWIVQSLNQDVGYDQMVKQMLAADETSPADREAGYATGFLVRNWYALNPNDWMRANVEHVGKAFLGLTLNCAHCHDHKYDPISQADYFRFRAFFEPLYVRQDRVPGQADPGPFQDYDYSTLRKVQHLGAVRVFDKNPDAPTWFYTGGDERNRQTERGSIAPGVPRFLDSGAPAIESIELPATAWYPGLDPDLQATLAADAITAVELAEQRLAKVPSGADAPSDESTDRLAAVEAEYAAAREHAHGARESQALSGTQSLVLDGGEGRRILQHRLRSLSEVRDGLQIGFRLRLATDTHFNFQLAKDVDQGLTAALVAWKQGRIVSYQPGSTSEFEAGRYDFAAGQKDFQVELELQPADDRALLTVQTLPDNQAVVAAVPIAINQWNPAEQDAQGIFLDAQSGSRIAIDEIEFRNPEAESAEIRFDFEPPIYALASDVVGTAGWELSDLGKPSATSVVSSAFYNPAIIDLERELAAARRAAELPKLRKRSAEQCLAARRTELASLQHRIAAEQARYGVKPTADVAELVKAAVSSHRQAIVRAARAEVTQAEFELAQAESRPADDDERNKLVDAAREKLQRARSGYLKQAAAAAKLTQYPPLSPTYPKTSTGRRKALSDWITARRNPLTARVAVNHIWARHFHKPLVASVYDFGRGGAKPTHPELLDWLAVELIESNWSMKHIHRLIVTSDAYLRSSHPQPAAADLDPENRLLSRMNTGRMEAEVLRDSLLACAEMLQPTVGGRPLGNDQAMTTYRRSLYYEVYPEDGGASEFGVLFDAPSPLECYRRTRSIVPQQALALTNSDLIHRVSAVIVENWKQSTGAPREPVELSSFVTEMFLKILNRPPNAREAQLCENAFNQQLQIQKADSPDRAETATRESLVRVLLNHNDFVTIR